MSNADNIETTRYQRLVQIGQALGVERNHKRLLEMILNEAREISNADGGTLYLRTKDDQLRFEIVHSLSLGLHLGGISTEPIRFSPIPLWLEDGTPNHRNVVTHAALLKKTVIIDDAYLDSKYDFSGTRAFDSSTGYHSTSFLTVPMKNHQDRVIGVLQLINATDPNSGKVIPFGPDLQSIIEALASLAAVALENQQLIEAQEKFFDSFIQTIASAIDAKSPYTGSHNQRVPELAKMIISRAAKMGEGVYADFTIDTDEMRALHIGAWMHDCGKITMPEHVIDKATKLETICNRIHEIRMRFEVLKRDTEIDFYKGMTETPERESQLRKQMEDQLLQLDEEFAFIAECNAGDNLLTQDDINRIQEIASRRWRRTIDNRLGISWEEMERHEKVPQEELPHEEPLLADKPWHRIPHPRILSEYQDKRFGFNNLKVPEVMYDRGEIYNLSVEQGTLTDEERFKINEHVAQTIVMLDKLPLPAKLKNVPEYAGTHHERMDGTGYPRGIKAGELSLPARAMVLADIFEALTAADRPYKKAKTLSESVQILSLMAKEGHIDPELFQFFVEQKIYDEFANKFLSPEQADEVSLLE